MKTEIKIVLAWFVIVTTIALLASCASAHSCDAYGQAKVSQNNDIASK